jgi:hypothetical protein
MLCFFANALFILAKINNPKYCQREVSMENMANEQRQNVIKYLKAPMLECLARVVSELKEQFTALNKEVIDKAGIDLHLELVAIEQCSEDKWTVVVNSNTWMKTRKENFFSITWMSGTCPSYFLLFQRGRAAWTGKQVDIFSGAVLPHSGFVAKNIAIYSFGQQTQGVLSHQRKAGSGHDYIRGSGIKSLQRVGASFLQVKISED